MVRRLRLRCPKCQTAIEVRTPRDDFADATCPKCNLEFIVKVPPKTVRLDSGTQQTSGSPVHATEQRQDQTSDPKATAANAVLQPHDSDSDTFEPADWNRDSERRTASSVLPLLAFGGVVLLLIFSFLGAIGFFLMRSSEIALVRDWGDDTSASVAEDYLRLQREYFQSGIDADLQSPEDVTALLNQVPIVSRQLEDSLRRAIRSPLGSLAEQSAFRQKLTQLNREYSAKYREKFASFEGISRKIAGRLREDRLVDFDIMRLVTREFYLTGLFKMPTPTSPSAAIKKDELKIYREVLRRLESIESSEQAADVGAVIREVADQNFELAIQTSRIESDEGRNRQVGNERSYVKTLETCEMVESLLLTLLENRSLLDDDLKRAVNVFDASRVAIKDAETGATEAALKTRRMQSASGQLDRLQLGQLAHGSWRETIAELSSRNLGLPSDPLSLSLSFRDVVNQPSRPNRQEFDWDAITNQGVQDDPTRWLPPERFSESPKANKPSSKPTPPSIGTDRGIDDLLHGRFTGRTTLRLIITPHSPQSQREAIKFGSRIRASRSMYVTQGDSGLAGYSFSGDLE
ncbi:MAG: zinc ribbon domain-containing protein, partial [Planctomycetota bacterium]